MTPPKTAPYGSWKSPITSDMIVAGAVKLQEIALDGKDIYWLERRPQEAGRNVIVKYTAKGDMIDVTPQPFNVRTRVHEYGGAAFLVHESQIYFSNYEDQRIYRHTPDSDPEPITSEGPFWYADGVIDVARNRLICVREDHSQSERDAINTIVGIKLDQSHAGDVLESGNDFYSNPRVSPDGSKLAWLTWNHPNMPWDGTELWVAHIQLDGSLKKPQKIAGGTDESIFQPEWSPDGILYFVSDRTGWWNL
ncbi:S9 family peptidase, partial [candidate division KSB1 bacterium]|nr:S9 family peptidase [candidate division KSB1 bacterium]NIR69996.1 S9 family peptidase [candidate division KSB1 bacterium]NIS23019.1 S9 family peptidase [candidate division KSB1 bacterium]NIT69877.1 S9 family peptidase [candidate division KSB1 bacterium]NIU23526.1 S9 family peptidase [candidate division KSB1 bacterium]